MVLPLQSRALLQLHFEKMLSGKSEKIKKWDLLLQENPMNWIQCSLLTAGLGLAMAATALERLLACAGDKLALEGTIVPHDIDIGL